MKFSVNACALGSLSMRSTCCRSTSGLPSSLWRRGPRARRPGMELHRKYDSRVARSNRSACRGRGQVEKMRAAQDRLQSDAQGGLESVSLVEPGFDEVQIRGQLASSWSGRRNARGANCCRIVSASASVAFDRSTPARRRVVGGGGQTSTSGPSISIHRTASPGRHNCPQPSRRDWAGRTQRSAAIPWPTAAP